MPLFGKRKRRKNAPLRFDSPLSPKTPQMALALRGNYYVGGYADRYNNASRSMQSFINQQQNAERMAGMRNMWGASMYGNPYSRSSGSHSFGTSRTPRFGRSTYNNGYYGSYSAYSRRSPSLSPFGVRANQYRSPYSRYTSHPAYNYDRDYGRFNSAYQPSYRDRYPSFSRRSHQRDSYYDEDDYMSDDDYESDMEDSYYPSAYRRQRGNPGWDDDDDMFEDEDFDLDDDGGDESDYDDYEYGMGGYGYEPYAYDRYGGYGERAYGERGYPRVWRDY